MNGEAPMIWTSKGNVLASTVSREVLWDVQETYIKHVERFLDVETGEVVKESADVIILKGVEIGAVAAPLG